MKQVVYLIRHASPDWNRKDLIYHLPPGPPLREQGKEEARALGAFLLQTGARQVFTSPLERCLNTAQIVAEILAASLQVVPGLTEWQPGELEQAVQQRILPVFEQALQTGQPACLVTHGGPILALLGALGMPDEPRRKLCTFDHNNILPPAGVWKVSRDEMEKPWEMHLVFKPVSETLVV